LLKIAKDIIKKESVKKEKINKEIYTIPCAGIW
jgi:hypothetical protein